MSIQKFPLAALQKIRTYIQTALALPDTEQQVQLASGGEPPEPESIDDLSSLFKYGGLPKSSVSALNQPQWFISTVNPAAALLKLPGLKLKPDVRLVSYLYRAPRSGVGLVWAVPDALSTTAHLEAALAPSGGISQFPKPEGALPHFMDAIEGDRSPASFLVASILRRELQEFGSLGDRRSWSYHTLIDQVPPNASWQWATDPPTDLAPKVRIFPDDRAVVEFFTWRTADPATLCRHLDQYSQGQYRANNVDRAIARTGG